MTVFHNLCCDYHEITAKIDFLKRKLKNEEKERKLKKMKK